MDEVTLDEKRASEGLNVRGYSGKWRKAQEIALRNETDDIRLLPYWERVRVIFLELGGEYINEAARKTSTE